jgi:short-subunit dehydrogenase
MGKVLILGGTSDIGIELAHIYASHGFKVILAGRNTDRLKEISQDISIRYDSNIEIIKFDAQDFSSHKTIIDGIENLTEAIYVFGYLGDQAKAEINFAESEKIIDVNYKGAVNVLNAIADLFKRNGGKIIIGVSSVAGDRGRQSNYIYGSAKAAFTAYLQGLRNSLYAHKIRVLTIKPGFVATKMTADLNLSGILTVSARSCAKSIFKARTKSSDIVYISWKWKYIMWIIRLIPEAIFKRLKL